MNAVKVLGLFADDEIVTVILTYIWVQLKEMVCSFLPDGKIPQLPSSKISLFQDFMRLVLLVGLCFITQFLSVHAVVDCISQTAWVLCFAHFDH